jgi:hypothetical protein
MCTRVQLFMKKSSRWGGIVACVIGVLLLGASLLNIADTISNPTSLPLIDTAGIIGSILNTVLAIRFCSYILFHFII